MNRRQVRQSLMMIDNCNDKDEVPMLIEDMIIDMLLRIEESDVRVRKTDELTACLLLIRVALTKHEILRSYKNCNEISTSYIIALTIIIGMRGSKFQETGELANDGNREKITEILATLFEHCPCASA